MQKNSNPGIVRWRILSIVLTASAVFFVDRITKAYWMTRMTEDATPLRFISGILDVTAHRNFGLIANISVSPWFSITLTTLILVVICWKLSRIVALSSLPCTIYPLSLIIGGALGNLYDRLAMGFVFDWILLFNRSIFNLADVGIGVGIVWITWREWQKKRASSWRAEHVR